MIKEIHTTMAKAIKELAKCKITLFNVEKIVEDIKSSDDFELKQEGDMLAVALASDKCVAMITGDHKHRQRVGNGAIGDKAFSAFDERMAYLSPVAYRYLFCAAANPHILNNLKGIE